MVIKWGDYAIFKQENGTNTFPMFIDSIVYSDEGVIYYCKEIKQNQILPNTSVREMFHHHQMIDSFDGDVLRKKWDEIIDTIESMPGFFIDKFYLCEWGICFNGGFSAKEISQ